jgi:hypothetical protein
MDLKTASRDEIVLHISYLKREIHALTKALQAYDRVISSSISSPSMRFYQKRPLVAIKQVLSEKGPLTQATLTKELVEGGAIVGKKRAESNIRISIEKTLRTGALKQIGNLIGLPEWSDEKFKTDPYLRQ